MPTSRQIVTLGTLDSSAINEISVPELVILRRVMKPRLIAVFVIVVAAGILAVGYGFNLLYA